MSQSSGTPSKSPTACSVLFFFCLKYPLASLQCIFVQRVIFHCVLYAATWSLNGCKIIWIRTHLVLFFCSFLLHKHRWTSLLKRLFKVSFSRNFRPTFCKYSWGLQNVLLLSPPCDRHLCGQGCSVFPGSLSLQEKWNKQWWELVCNAFS